MAVDVLEAIVGALYSLVWVVGSGAIAGLLVGGAVGGIGAALTRDPEARASMVSRCLLMGAVTGAIALPVLLLGLATFGFKPGDIPPPS